MTAKPLGRRPGRSSAREDILAAARGLFGEVGYDRATVRAIARRAGVDPALVHHYFGSKEDLLAAALVLPVDPAEVLAGVGSDPGHVGEELVRRVLGIWEDPALRGPMLSLMRTALSHERAAAGMRELLTRTVLPVVAALGAVDDAPLRAALVSSQVIGLALGREVLRVPSLAVVPLDELARAVGPAVTYYLTGDLSGPGSVT